MQLKTQMAPHWPPRPRAVLTRSYSGLTTSFLGAPGPVDRCMRVEVLLSSSDDASCDAPWLCVLSCMLAALRSAHALRHICPRVVSTIGRRPRCRGWIPVLQPTPADAGSSDPVGCFHSSSSGSSSNQASTACASAGDNVSTAAGYVSECMPCWLLALAVQAGAQNCSSARDTSTNRLDATHAAA